MLDHVQFFCNALVTPNIHFINRVLGQENVNRFLTHTSLQQMKPQW